MASDALAPAGFAFERNGKVVPVFASLELPTVNKCLAGHEVVKAFCVTIGAVLDGDVDCRPGRVGEGQQQVTGLPS